MAKFLSTTDTSSLLEQLIKKAKERLWLISPYLKINGRIRELIEDQNRMKIDIRIVYGKNELHPDEITWLRSLESVRTSYCKNLHAKCYLNENHCIITSMNLYDFSQMNNNEMGIYLSRNSDGQVFTDAHEEAKRIIRISDEVRISLEKIPQSEDEIDSTKLPSSKLAKNLGMSTSDLLKALVGASLLELREDKHYLTDAGKKAGGEFRTGRYGPFFLWPSDLTL